MGTVNANLFSASTGVKVPSVNGTGNYPSGLGTGDAGFIIYDSSLKTLVFWNGTQWEMAVESPIPEKALFDVIDDNDATRNCRMSACQKLSGHIDVVMTRTMQSNVAECMDL